MSKNTLARRHRLVHLSTTTKPLKDELPEDFTRRVFSIERDHTNKRQKAQRKAARAARRHNRRH